MESVLVTTEIVAVTMLTLILALVIEPLMVMAVLGLANKAAQSRLLRPAPEPRVAELRLLATGPKLCLLASTAGESGGPSSMAFNTNK